MGGEPPVGHAVSDDVEGQHSRDLGWATNQVTAVVKLTSRLVLLVLSPLSITSWEEKMVA